MARKLRVSGHPPLAAAGACAAATALLLAPAAAAEPAAPAPAAETVPQAATAATPATPAPLVAVQLDAPPSARVGEAVRVEAHAAAPAGAVTVYSWDWTGTGSYGEPSSAPDATHVFTHPGRFLLGVSAAVAGGAPVQAHVAIVVSAQPAAAVSAHRRAPRASAASTGGDPAVTIRDFAFEAATVTVHAGESVTWTNQGPSRHTATGSGFNTGILAPGQSSTITFSHPGTFSYRCSIHPFMRGVVVVTAAASSSSGSSSSGSSSSGSSSSGSSAQPAAEESSSQAAVAPGTKTLPFTGLNLLPQVLAAIAAIALGVALWAAGRGRRAG